MDPFSAMALIGAGSTLVSNIWNSAESARNRKFQERMSSTAHRREVADLQAAGINPMLSRMGSGASAPGGDRAQMADLGSSALSAMMLKKQIGLIEAQTQGEVARTQGQQVANQLAHSGLEFQVGKLKADATSAGVSAEQAQRLLPLAVKRAEAEISQITNSAEAARARAFLDQQDAVRAMNDAEFEAMLGRLSPALRTLALLWRSVARPR